MSIAEAVQAYSSETPNIKGIAERDRPISVGWCGNDNCEHKNHKEQRAYQASADKRNEQREKYEQ